MNPGDVENTGKAAHIFSAVPNGPRGQGNLGPEDLRHASNGIWLCSDHADLIDKKSGQRYPATIVKSWKALHEFRIAYEHSGRSSAFGFVRELKIHQSPIFEHGTTVELGKTTFLIGPNSSGKTALCQWFSAVDNQRHLPRWLEPHTLNYTLLFETMAEHRLSIEMGNNATLTKLDEIEVVANHNRIAVVFIENKGEKKYFDDLEHFCDLLKLDPVSTRSLARFVCGISLVEKAEFVQEKNDDGDVEEILYCELTDKRRLSFRALSGGEKGRVLLEFAISQARSVSKFAPALLIVEWEELNIDVVGFEFYTAFLAGSENRFQSIITRHETTELIEGLGWQTYHLDRSSGQRGRVVPIFQPSEEQSA